VLQYVAVCCTVVAGLKLVGNSPCLISALLTNKVQCVTVCCKFVAVCCSVLQVCCSVLQCVASVLQCVAVCCKCVAVCCSVLLLG